MMTYYFLLAQSFVYLSFVAVLLLYAAMTCPSHTTALSTAVPAISTILSISFILSSYFHIMKNVRYRIRSTDTVGAFAAR
jgi:hypothetical protein